eukprot:scaffold44529_cov30-Tisochrysis_lutea.AAC.2
MRLGTPFVGGLRLRIPHCNAVGHTRHYTKHFLNLSNGVEAISGLLADEVLAESLGFCRIQSSQCEAQDFPGLLANLDHDMMLHLALGHECRVYDFGSRGAVWIDPDGHQSEKYVPRAIWWGLEWWRYALNNVWELPNTRAPILRGVNVESRFREALRALPKKQRKRLKYYRAFTPTDLEEVRLLGYYAAAETDGDKAAHRRILRSFSGLLSENIQSGKIEVRPEKFGMELYDPLVLSGRVPGNALYAEHRARQG